MTLEKRINQNLHPILLFLSISMLVASNLFFAKIPGSIALLWIVNVIFGIFLIYRICADVEDETLVEYRELTNQPANRVSVGG